MALKLYPEENIQSIASAIRTKNGLSTSYTTSQMAQAIADIPSGGMDNATSILDRTISGIYSNSEITQVGRYAFYDCRSLTGIDLPNCTQIGSNAFIYCSVLSSINIPNCSIIRTYAFQSAGVSPNSGIFTLSVPKCSQIEGNAFNSCKTLKALYAPSCSYIGATAFAYCTNLDSAYLPICNSITASCFRNCSSLTQLDLPKCGLVGTNGFAQCSNLSILYLGSNRSERLTISGSAFTSCRFLLSLYILNTSTSLASLVNINAFAGTPISNNTASTGGIYGSIYVPASLYSAYIVSTNWVNYSSRFASLTDAQISALFS